MPLFLLLRSHQHHLHQPRLSRRSPSRPSAAASLYSRFARSSWLLLPVIRSSSLKARQAQGKPPKSRNTYSRRYSHPSALGCGGAGHWQAQSHQSSFYVTVWSLTFSTWIVWSFPLNPEAPEKEGQILFSFLFSCSATLAMPGRHLVHSC